MSARKPFPGVATPDALKAAEKKGYGKGYRAGRGRAWGWCVRITEIARAYRQQAREGHPPEPDCSTCARWSRGHGSAQWGHCRGDFEYGVEPRMWPDTSDYRQRSPDSACITTTQDFGCVSWLPRPKSRNQGEQE